MQVKEMKKKDDNTLTIITFDLIEYDLTPEYLISHKQDIINQKNKDNIQRDLEIEEVDKYLSEMKKLNINLKPEISYDPMLNHNIN